MRFSFPPQQLPSPWHASCVLLTSSYPFLFVTISCSMLPHIIAQLGSTLVWTRALQLPCIFAANGYETSAQSYFLYIILYLLMKPTKRCVGHRVLAFRAKYHNQQLRKFRTAPTVEMLRVTWEKTSNPFVRTSIAALYSSKTSFISFKLLVTRSPSPCIARSFCRAHTHLRTHDLSQLTFSTPRVKSSTHPEIH